MKKQINLLLVGFLIFIIGLIISNFELNKFEAVNYFPDEFQTLIERFSIKIDQDKEYELKKAKYNENIKIEKKVDNSLEDEIIVEVEHSKTSATLNTITVVDDEVEIIFSNEFVFNGKDLKNIFDLALKSIKEKRMYNYKLLKYSNIKIYGSEESLEKIEIDK